MLVAQILTGTLEFVDQPDAGTATLRRLIGGALDTAFLLRNPYGAGDIIGYAAADGRGLRPTCRLGAQVIAGPLVIVGVAPDGTHRSLTHAELEGITLDPVDAEADAEAEADTADVPALHFLAPAPRR